MSRRRDRPRRTAKIERADRGRPGWRRALVWGLPLIAAVGLLASARWLVPDPPGRLRQRGDQAAREGRWDEALAAWRAVNATGAADARSWLGEARACLALGRASQAEHAMEQASGLAPSWPEPWLVRLELLRVEDRQAEARRLGWAAYQAVPASSRREVLRALTLALLADTPDSLARATLARWVASDPADLDALAALDRRMAEHPRADDPKLDDRVARLQEALDREPGHAGVREALGLNLASLGEIERGRALLDAWPEDVRDERYDRLRGRWDLEHDDRRAEAVAAFGRALDALPHDWRTLYRQTLALKRLGRDAEARDAAARVGRLREALDPRRLGPRLDADLAHLDDAGALLDLAALCRSVGLTRLADAWEAESSRRDAPSAARVLP